MTRIAQLRIRADSYVQFCLDKKMTTFAQTVLQQANQLLVIMTRAEKAQLLQWVVRDLGDAAPCIENNPEVCGGAPCIVRTRIPVWVLEQARRLGTSEADLLRCYPSLRAEDLTNAWAYVRSHPAEIEQQIRENEED
jgi:uncharacterized protein (DUF433 family)